MLLGRFCQMATNREISWAGISATSAGWSRQLLAGQQSAGGSRQESDWWSRQPTIKDGGARWPQPTGVSDWLAGPLTICILYFAGPLTFCILYFADPLAFCILQVLLHFVFCRSSYILYFVSCRSSYILYVAGPLTFCILYFAGPLTFVFCRSSYILYD